MHAREYLIFKTGVVSEPRGEREGLREREREREEGRGSSIQ